jgi:hypothetical protein
MFKYYINELIAQVFGKPLGVCWLLARSRYISGRSFIWPSGYKNSWLPSVFKQIPRKFPSSKLLYYMLLMQSSWLKFVKFKSFAVEATNLPLHIIQFTIDQKTKIQQAFFQATISNHSKNVALSHHWNKVSLTSLTTFLFFTYYSFLLFLTEAHKTYILMWINKYFLWIFRIVRTTRFLGNICTRKAVSIPWPGIPPQSVAHPLSLSPVSLSLSLAGFRHLTLYCIVLNEMRTEHENESRSKQPWILLIVLLIQYLDGIQKITESQNQNSHLLKQKMKQIPSECKSGVQNVTPCIMVDRYLHPQDDRHESQKSHPRLRVTITVTCLVQFPFVNVPQYILKTYQNLWHILFRRITLYSSGN